MVARKKKKSEVQCATCTLTSVNGDIPGVSECPFFDIKHLEHKSLNGFIKHPESFFLKSRYMSLFSGIEPERTDSGEITAFSFSSNEYRVPGSIIEVSIRTVNEIHKINGKVIASIQLNSGFEIGMLLMRREDSIKLRYIEQICYIDSRLLTSII